MRKLIRASAGSGKTFQLSSHFLRQLFLGHAPETILATTFTRKAAGEILGRVLLRLAEAADDTKAAKKLGEFLEQPDITKPKARDLLANVTRNLHRLRVCTLDSFFQQVARSLTLELGLPPGWSIIDEHTDAEMREQAIDAVLSQQVPEDAQNLMHMLAKGRSKRSVRDLIDDTVQSFHELFLLTDDEAWNKLPKYPRLTTEQMQQALLDLHSCALPTDKNYEKARAADAERFATSQWDEFVKTGIASKVLAGETTYYRKEISEELIAAYCPLLNHAKAELLDRLAQQMRAIRNLISRFDKEYSRLRSDHGWLGFGDVTRTLAKSVEAASGERMSFRLDSSIRNLLLDEFQDTSADQWKILKRLTQNLDRHEKHSFFCVGDPKQAIYGWRGGVAEILNAVPEAVPGIIDEPMDKSRRSAPAVMDAVNKIFQHIKHHSNLEDYHVPVVDWSNKFPEHSTANETMPGYVCFRSSPVMEGDSADERRGPWHRWVAEQIRDLHEQTPGATIGVLTRTNSAVARIVHELSQLNVPASEEGGTPPTDSAAVLAMLSLLQLTSHPGCHVSRYHVAASPLARVTGLLDWKNTKQAETVAANLRSRLMDEGYGRTLQTLSESIRDVCTSRDRLRLQQIVAQGWQFDQTGSLNPCDFVRLLENSKFQKSEPAPVRVMTIHQSKGLEFDVVVLPDLEVPIFKAPDAAFTGPGAGEVPDRVCVWSNKALWPMLPEGLQDAFRDTVARQISDNLSVFYVAVTRAAHAMHMLTKPITSKQPPKTFAGLLLASLTDQSQAEASVLLYETGDADWYKSVPEMTQVETETRPSKSHVVPHVRLAPMPDGRRRGLKRRAPSRHDETRLYLPAVTSLIARRETMPASTDVAEAGVRTIVDPKTRGTVMHAWFECIEWLNDDASKPDESVLRAAASKLTVPDAAVDRLLPGFYAAIQQPETRRVFQQATLSVVESFAAFRNAIESGQATTKVERERTFALLHENELVLGSIDRLVLLMQDGRPIAADIVDFKTDRFGGDRNRWIEARRLHYGPQLEEYRFAVSECFGVPIQHIGTRLLLIEADAVISTP